MSEQKPTEAEIKHVAQGIWTARWKRSSEWRRVSTPRYNNPLSDDFDTLPNSLKDELLGDARAAILAYNSAEPDQ